MYNEVHKSCYNCGATCTIQIPQIVLGFGNFNLDNPDSMKELTHEQKLELKEYVEKESFYCGHESCNSAFEIEVEVAEMPPWNGRKTRVTI